MRGCRVYWGSHGCYRKRGHRGQHICRGCCRNPFHLITPFHRFLGWRWADWYGGCVGRWPYYGKTTVFYGEDA